MMSLKNFVVLDCGELGFNNEFNVVICVFRFKFNLFNWDKELNGIWVLFEIY